MKGKGRERKRRSSIEIALLTSPSFSSHEERSAKSRKNWAVGERERERALLFAPLSGPSSDFTENHGDY